MNSVDVKRVPEGYVVSCLVGNLPAAMRAVDLLLSVNEAAFAPGSLDALRIERNAYDAHPLNLVRQDTGD